MNYTPLFQIGIDGLSDLLLLHDAANGVFSAISQEGAFKATGSLKDVVRRMRVYSSYARDINTLVVHAHKGAHDPSLDPTLRELGDIAEHGDVFESVLFNRAFATLPHIRARRLREEIRIAEEKMTDDALRHGRPVFTIVTPDRGSVAVLGTEHGDRFVLSSSNGTNTLLSHDRVVEALHHLPVMSRWSLNTAIDEPGVKLLVGAVFNHPVLHHRLEEAMRGDAQASAYVANAAALHQDTVLEHPDPEYRKQQFDNLLARYREDLQRRPEGLIIKRPGPANPSHDGPNFVRLKTFERAGSPHVRILEEWRAGEVTMRQRSYNTRESFMATFVQERNLDARDYPHSFGGAPSVVSGVHVHDGDGVPRKHGITREWHEAGKLLATQRIDSVKDENGSSYREHWHNAKGEPHRIGGPAVIIEDNRSDPPINIVERWNNGERRPAMDHARNGGSAPKSATERRQAEHTLD